jgi:hypothetical protein
MSSHRLPRLAAACFVLGCLTVLLIDAPVARIVGVPLIFAGLFLGVAAIATPAFLEGDRPRRE